MYRNLSEELVAAVEDGLFTLALQSTATQENSTVLAHATSSTVTVYEATQPPTPQPTFAVPLLFDGTQVPYVVVAATAAGLLLQDFRSS